MAIPVDWPGATQRLDEDTGVAGILTAALAASLAQTRPGEAETAIEEKALQSPEDQAQSRTALIQTARTEKEANLTPWARPKTERIIGSIENSLPYRLLTGETHGFAVSFGNMVPGSGFAIGPTYTEPMRDANLILRIDARAAMNESYSGRLEVSAPRLFSDYTFMVSRKHNELTMRSALWVAAIAVAGALGQQVFAQELGRKFYPDDPLWREPPPRPVSGIATRDVDHIYDFLQGSYVTPRREGQVAKHAPQPALDVNTLGEVPDSDWYTNRHHLRRMSIEELQHGPRNSTPPDPGGQWRITSAKGNGITPGFVIEDAKGHRYVLKFDPPLYPEMCSAADVIGSKIFCALGYNTPENYVVHFQREQLEVTGGVMYRHPGGKRIPLTAQIVDKLLKAQPKSADGTYRALASRWLEGWRDRSITAASGVTIRTIPSLIRTAGFCGAWPSSAPG